jgi:hypothetical protein
MNDLDKVSRGHIQRPVRLNAQYKEKSTIEFAKLYANEFNRIISILE